MAVNRFEAGVVTRTKGQNVIARAAYNAREALTDERTGEKKDYRDKGGLEFSGIFAPANAPSWVRDREKLWNAIEEREDFSTRPDQAQLARDFKMSLPYELTAEQRRRLVTDFAREMSRKGMILDVAIHAPDAHSDPRHFHVHMLVTMREITPLGFGNKVRAWNKKEELDKWKDRWSELGARYLERAGFEKEAERYRVGHKTLKEQQKEAVKRGDKEHADKMDREPTIPLGPHGAAMGRRGVETPRARDNRMIVERNKKRSKDRGEKMGKEGPGAPTAVKGMPKKIIGGMTNTLTDAISSLFSPIMTPERQEQADRSREEREAIADEAARRRHEDLMRDRSGRDR